MTEPPHRCPVCHGPTNASYYEGRSKGWQATVCSLCIRSIDLTRLARAIMEAHRWTDDSVV